MSTLRSLRSTTCLRALGVVLASNVPSLFLELQTVVNSCSHLDSLAVYAFAQPFGSDSLRHTVTSWPWDGVPTEDMPTLPNIRTLSLQNFCICHDGNDSWIRFLCWRRLRNASFSCPSFLVRLQDRLESVRSLQLKVVNSRDVSICLRQSLCKQTKMALIRFNNLETLEFINLSGAIDVETLRHVGTSLRVLRVHEDEEYYKKNYRNAITHSQIIAISENCGLLTDLMIDVEHDLTWVGVSLAGYSKQRLTFRCEANGNFRPSCNKVELHQAHRTTSRAR